jgi:hypothetical protein
MFTLSRIALALTGLFAMTAQLLPAQTRAAEEEDRWLAGFPNWTVSLYGGLANQGRFLLQSVTFENGLIAQRELQADNSFTWGGAVGARILPRTSVRLAFTRTSTDLDYEDDTGTGLGLLDRDDVAGLSSSVLSLEALRFLLPPAVRLTPYGGLGVVATWWNLDERGLPPLIVAGNGDDTQFRWGGAAVLGLQYRATANWAARLEATTFTIGNPFTGDESFVPLTGFTIDEPTRVRQTHIRLVAAYTFAPTPVALGRR